MDEEIDARTLEIVGRPPRLVALGQEELGEDEWAHVRRLEQIGPWSEGMPVSAMMRTLLRHPAAFAHFVRSGTDLTLESTLSPRERELIILRTGWLCGAPFQFGEHVL